MSPKQADALKQSKLDFSAAKRTASTASTGKTKSTTSTPRLKTTTTSSQPSPSPAVSSSKVSVPTEDAVKDADEIEPAEDLVDDSESVSSVSTWETLEEKPDSPVTKAPAPPTASQSTPRVTRSAAKKTVPVDSSKAQPKVEEAAKTPFKVSNATEEQVAKTVEANSQKPNTEKALPELKVKAAKYRKYHDLLKEKTGDIPTIHGENENNVHQILRFFDTSYEYGPCVGVSRRERWDRAQALGLNPPKEVDEILNTKEGKTLSEYSESVFYGQV